MLKWYLVGCLVYGCLVMYGSIVDKAVPQKVIIQAMILTPIWPVILILVINNLRRK